MIYHGLSPEATAADFNLFVGPPMRLSAAVRILHLLPLHRSVAGLLLALTALGLVGCQSTIITQIRSQPVNPVPKGLLSRGEIRQEAKAASRLLKKDDQASTPAELSRWAGNDPSRLSTAAEIVLQKADGPRVYKTSRRGGFALAACELAWRSLVASGVPASGWMTNASTLQTASVYNSALSIFLSERGDQLAAGAGAVALETPLGPATVTPRFPPPSQYGANYFDELIPADYVAASGFSERIRNIGLGTPLVGVRKRTPARKQEMQLQPPGRGVMAPLGSLAKFQRRKTGELEVQLSLYDLNLAATTNWAGSKVALAGDFTAPLALSFNGLNDLMIGIRALLKVGSSEPYNGIYLTEPFDPDRTPVLLLHGLSSSPLVWRNIVTKAMRNPLIRKNYQFWYAFYSTGEPITPSAALIRARIAAIRHAGDPSGNSRASQNMIVVGYSMGGVMARALVTDPGDEFWKVFSDRPFDEIPLDPEDRSVLQEWLFWKPATDIKEVIFLATPHQGTRMADASFAQLGRMLVSLPGDLVQFQKRIFSVMGQALGDPKLSTKTFNGIDSLSPKSPIYELFKRAPIVSNATAHSVIGDRGRGNSPDSSDGVVGYWSSHLDTAVSEIIVPTGHDVQTDPESEELIQEVLIEALPSGDR